ncbi:SubName: Full=Uncharacterized protein {ECO:0000313/EMBL:KIM28354.1} [Serendipita indica DSM 11827]|nr:SubName: Full=Uncharacterized protein {ECO:0000313/EMBL:KIM28354.1} [Serendipita indica DSM 11827]
MVRWPWLVVFAAVSSAKELIQLSVSEYQDGTCELLSIRTVQHRREGINPAKTHVERQIQPQEPGNEPWTLLRIYGSSEEEALAQLDVECKHRRARKFDASKGIDPEQRVMGFSERLSWENPLPPPPSLIVKPLVLSGPSDNRVDLVFFGDGYTPSEEAKFFADALRLAEDISANQTFSSVKPLLNIWAAYTPSNFSGIGTDLEPRDTAFGLYRVGTELRAIYCAKKPVARAACASLGPGCNFPILLANSEFYGGLGGEFSITTSSVLNGALVLRHELGHSIIDVGEEYDGGYAYYGPNSSPIPPTISIKWSHWLDSPAPTARAERAISPLQAYPWTILNASTPYTALFDSSGLFSWHMVRFSLSGFPKKHDLTVLLDGENIGWEPRPDIGMDRWHYDIKRQKALLPGQHNLTFSVAEDAQVSQGQLCSFEIIEYGNSSEFNNTEGHIGAYPTFSMWNGTTYRPTNEGCLMRQVVLPSFCRPCLEGLWLQLLRRVELIDDLTAIRDRTGSNIFIRATPVRLGQLRDDPPANAETLEISWTVNGTTLGSFKNQTQFILPVSEAVGDWTVTIQLHTDQMYSSMSNLYMLPSDQEEWTRLNILHTCFLLGIGELYPEAHLVHRKLTSQVPNERTVLDLGCGNGQWMTELGLKFPNAGVTGVDLTPCPLRPDTSANCTFELDNVDLGLSHFFDQFDVVHARCIALGISDYRRMIEEAVLCLKPGGMLVLVELDWQVYEEDKKTPASEFSEASLSGSALQRIFRESRTATIHNGSGLTQASNALSEGLWACTLADPQTCKTADLWFPIGNHSDGTSSYIVQYTADIANSDGKFPPSADGSYLDAAESSGQSLARLPVDSQQLYFQALHRGLHRLLKDSGRAPAELETWSELADAELSSTENLRWVRFQYCWGRRHSGLDEPVTPPTTIESTEQTQRVSFSIPGEIGSAATAHIQDIHQVLASDPAYPYFIVYEKQADSLRERE